MLTELPSGKYCTCSQSHTCVAVNTARGRHAALSTYIHVTIKYIEHYLERKEKGKKENYNNLNGLEKYNLYSLYSLYMYMLVVAVTLNMKPKLKEASTTTGYQAV